MSQDEAHDEALVDKPRGTAWLYTAFAALFVLLVSIYAVIVWIALKLIWLLWSWLHS